MQNKIILTEDGSSTIYVPALDEHYHSTHGAINESKHVYIETGLNHLSKKNIHILEIGFGTGLNAFLTLASAIEKNLSVRYFSIEKYPISDEEVKTLNYPQQIDAKHGNYFPLLHQAEWDEEVSLCPQFNLRKIHADLKLADLKRFPLFDLIYFDAFAPGKQPDMWSEEILTKIADQTAPGGVFVTYCAKGSVRRMLNSLGFQMERLPGPIGKKEILRGIKAL